jgi:hypothetical protein
LPPVSSLHEFRPFAGGPGNNDVVLASVDHTADSMHVFLNLPASVSDAEIYQMASQGQGRLDQVDVNLFKTGMFGIPNGNNVLTIVTFEPTGTSSIIRQTALNPDSARGAGLGDLNHDGIFATSDIANVGGAFEEVLYSRNTLFNPAADTTGDGLVNTYDLLGLGSQLTSAGVDQAVYDLWYDVKQSRVDFNNDGTVDGLDVALLGSSFGTTDWTFDLDVSGAVNAADRDFLFANFEVVPEPAAWALMLIGVVGLPLVLRRGRRAA